jgi:hypothetical protein
MSGNYYDLTNTKKILSITETDILDDELLNTFGEMANQHIDNILEPVDIGIPYTTTSILNDVKSAANYYTCSLYKGKKQDFEGAKFWKDMFQNIIDNIIANRKNDHETITVNGFGRNNDEPHDHNIIW